MYLYKTIQQELADYPLDYFVNRFRINSLSLQLTKRCTNRCAHCSNYGSPQAGEFLDLALIKKVVAEAAQLKYSGIMLWGGEPFLHRDFYQILEYVLQQGFNVCVNTNGFWAESRQAVRELVRRFQPLLGPRQQLSLSVSCDTFHQSQRPTPARNIANIVLELCREPAGFGYELQSVRMSGDTTFAGVLALIQEEDAAAPLDLIRQKQRFVPLECSVGRAKKLRLAGPDPYAESALLMLNGSPNILLFISAAGDGFLYENWLGEQILPCGNIKQMSLVELEQQLNRQRLLKLLHFQPKKYFFYPFRKYLDLQKLSAEIAGGKIKNTFFLRDYIVKLLQTTAKQFDKSADLKKARQIYSRACRADKALAALAVIEAYGDLSDVFQLRELRGRTADTSVKQKISALLEQTYSLS
ncbi:MAG: radical SAM protein [Candidatus Margulisbacteria bacterium]|jgi:hypothetical protein|nr:radical SAM protein [Candidatus Margulisiibacteriota bacterium]